MLFTISYPLQSGYGISPLFLLTILKKKKKLSVTRTPFALYWRFHISFLFIPNLHCIRLEHWEFVLSTGEICADERITLIMFIRNETLASLPKFPIFHSNEQKKSLEYQV